MKNLEPYTIPNHISCKNCKSCSSSSIMRCTSPNVGNRTKHVNYATGEVSWRYSYKCGEAECETQRSYGTFMAFFKKACGRKAKYFTPKE